MNISETASLYRCRVMHERLAPFRHRFEYRVFSLLLDIDRLADLAARSKLFAYNRFGLLSFHDKDHGPRDGSPLRPWVEAALRGAALEQYGARIKLFCFPRLLGYVFNPLSVYFCYDAENRLGAILYEVKNTFGDQHGYLLDTRASTHGRMISHDAGKVFHVSPFIAKDGDYRFRILPPAESIAIHIRHDGPEGPRLIATQTGRREAFSDAALLKAWLRHPLMTLKVMAAIHWQALFLWRKGAPFFSRPDPPAQPVSLPKTFEATPEKSGEFAA